jgi:YbgC/YbaW family acyl-CoA thioester hydrolase
LERARGEFFRQLGRSFLYWQENDTIFPIIECWLLYKGAARYDDLLTIELGLTALDKIGLGFLYRVFAPGGRLLVQAATQHVCTNIASKPKRIPTELAAALSPYVVGEADEATEGSRPA